MGNLHGTPEPSATLEQPAAGSGADCAAGTTAFRPPLLVVEANLDT